MIAGAGLVILCLSLASIERPTLRPWTASAPHPIASLGWAQANCATDLQLLPGTPRLQSEDFLRMTGELSVQDSLSGRTSVCSQAVAAARSVSDDVGSSAAAIAQPKHLASIK
jgi:hypothetical protein